MWLRSEQRSIVLSVLAMLCAMVLSGCGDDSKKVKKGDTIEFGGHYWTVLEVQKGKALILSDKVIENRPYHSQFVAVTWESSDIRKHLNTVFLHSFNPIDRNRILDTKVVTNNNPWYGTLGGVATTDKIFLLSLEEMVQHFGDSSKLKNRPVFNFEETKRDFAGASKEFISALEHYKSDLSFYFKDQYNKSRIAYNKDGPASSWWLRSPGNGATSAALVNDDGNVRVDGHGVHDRSVGFRPALWLNLEP